MTRPARTAQSKRMEAAQFDELPWYQRQYDEYKARYHETQQRIAEVEKRREALTAKRGKKQSHLHCFKRRCLLHTTKV